MGADRIVTLDVHNLAAFENAFRIGAENLEAPRLFADFITEAAKDAPVCVVAPDAGALKRAARFAGTLGKALGREVGTAFMEKHRSAGVVSGAAFVGDVKGAHAIIFDDLISTGGTIMRTAEKCRELGAIRVSAAATHGLFTGGDALLRSEAVDEVVVTDSVSSSRVADSPARAKLQIVSIGPLLAAAIGRLHHDGSLTQLLEL
jgi:ribose-phosphate pyrophosphokinase